ncbi:MAG: SUMF1/EgtB/PvdO family nonheme iron enzyme [Planctomycetes bacterium]|nr:SUMF1/EgtB/PvdO family nonheme iron enzyme [Planctomycetota bacterium]
MDSPEQRDAASPEGERLFREFLALQERGDAIDFERFCAERPASSPELRRIHSEWQQATLRLSRPPRGASLKRRFKEVFGRTVEAGLSVEPEPPLSHGPGSQELLRRLAVHNPAHTRYRLKDEIAHGGMGSIFKVWDEDLRRNLAMKVMLARASGAAASDSGSDDPRALSRFLDEAQVTAQLDHPGIVPVHELGVDDKGRVFFTMRLVEGADLRTVFEKAKLGEEGWSQTRALGVLLRVCEAMAYAHSKGVIHRDLKPDNVMVGRFGQTYVMDWGLARVLGKKDPRDIRIQQLLDYPEKEEERASGARASEAPLLTMEGDVVGTPSYMAPEQGMGRIDEVGPRSDVYSVGAMLYHLLAGRVPYERSGARLGPRAVLRRLLRGPPEPLAVVAPRVRPELMAICEKAMAHEIEQRYATMEELASDLRAYLEGRVVQAYESGAFAVLRKWVARNKTLAAASAALVALTVFFIVRLDAEAKVAVASERRAREHEAVANGARERASDLAARAERERILAQQERDRVLRLADVKRLAGLIGEMDGLWPAGPHMVAPISDWLDRAEELLGRRTEHEETLADLRSFAELQPDGAGGERRVFADAATAWWHDTLAELVAALAAFAADDPHGRTVAAMRARLEFAASVGARTVEHEAAAWEECARAIADAGLCPRYGGLCLAPQIGLVPLGRDPGSGLWEFWHVQSGERPARAPDGALAPGAESGLVLVLVPGGSFLMGAQGDAPQGAGYQERVEPEEGPPHEVALAPFFLAKYEMTQAQWLRATGENPSFYPAGQRFAGKDVTLLHPVENVCWERAREVLRWLDLQLPTEAQWEYACRAGSATAWWCGSAIADVQGAGNLADRFCREHGGPTTWTYEEALDDGHVVHAPVGSYRPNAFGLHDTIGNVWEWCRDGFGEYRFPAAAGDGLRQVEGARYRVFRGGAFSIFAYQARSSTREGFSADYRFNSLGLRPARALEPTAP